MSQSVWIGQRSTGNFSMPDSGEPTSQFHSVSEGQCLRGSERQIQLALDLGLRLEDLLLNATKITVINITIHSAVHNNLQIIKDV